MWASAPTRPRRRPSACGCTARTPTSPTSASTTPRASTAFRPSTPRSRSALRCRRDVLVEPEEVVRVVAGLDRGEAVPGGAGVRGANARGALVAHEADVGAVLALA